MNKKIFPSVAPGTKNIFPTLSLFFKKMYIFLVIIRSGFKEKSIYLGRWKKGKNLQAIAAKQREVFGGPNISAEQKWAGGKKKSGLTIYSYMVFAFQKTSYDCRDIRSLGGSCILRTHIPNTLVGQILWTGLTQIST